MHDFVVGMMPISWQARYWARWAIRRYGRTSHFYLEGLKGFRKTSGLLLKDCKREMDVAFARWGRCLT